MQNPLNQKTLFYLMLSLIYVLILVYLKPQEPAVFFLWIIAVIFSSLRLRLDIETKWIFIDALYIVMAIIYSNELVVLFFPLIALMIYYHKYYSVFLNLIIFIMIKPIDLSLVLIALVVMIGTYILSLWRLETHNLTYTIDELRQKNYQIEQEKEAIMASQLELSRISILSERDRIAQKLHDDLGHEITASLMSLRAYETLTPEASENKSFKVLKMRLEKAMASLRETVQQTKPDESYGYERFKSLIDETNDPKVTFISEGNLLALTETHYYLLTSVLKEGLTNIRKHAIPSLIEVSLIVQAPIVKLIIKNDGLKPENKLKGLGLTYMRKKVEALNGHLTIQKNYYFTLICILPIQIERKR